MVLEMYVPRSRVGTHKDYPENWLQIGKHYISFSEATCNNDRRIDFWVDKEARVFVLKTGREGQLAIEQRKSGWGIVRAPGPRNWMKELGIPLGLYRGEKKGDRWEFEYVSSKEERYQSR